MQSEQVSAVRWVIGSISSRGATTAAAPDATALSASGAHLTLAVPPSVADPSVRQSLTVRSIGESFSHGMRSSFLAKPMAELVQSAKGGNFVEMTIALSNVTDASINANLLMKMASSVDKGIKALTSQSG